MAATAEQRTQEEISANIKKMAKDLGKSVENTAELKKEQKERKDLLAQEKLLQAKYEEVLNQEVKEQAKQTQSFKSIASFVSIESKKYFQLTEQNAITWGGLAKSLKTGVKNWFDAASKQRTMLGRTLRLGATLWESTQKHILDNVKKLWGAVTGQINEVLGELGGILNWVKDSFLSVFKFIGSTFMGFFKRVPPADRRRNKLLQDLVAYARRREKRDLLVGGEEKKDSLGLIGVLAAIAAGVLGAFIGKFLIPFKTIYKAMKIGPMFTAVKTFFLRMKWVQKLFTGLGKFFAKYTPTFKKIWDTIKSIGSYIGKFFKWIAGFFGWVSKTGSVFGQIFAAFKFGFTKLAWPLQILLSVIDFIKGFMATEGNIAQKVIGGVKNAVVKFLEFPVKLIGWVVEKVLGLFGVETEGVADKIMGAIKKIVDIFTAFWNPIIGFFEGFFSTEGSLLDKLKGGLGGFFTGLADMLEIFKPLYDKIMGIIDKVKSWFGDDEEDEKEPPPKKKKEGGGWWPWGKKKKEEEPPVTTPKDELGVKVMANAQAKKENAAREKQTEDLIKSQEENTKKQIEANQKIADKQDAATAIAMGGNAQAAPAETPPDPLADEIEIWGALGGNNNI